MIVNFKYFIILGLALVFCIGCQKNDNSCKSVEYLVPFTLKKGDNACFVDGTELVLKGVIDSRCPCDAICIWEGEFSLTFDVTIGNKHHEYTFGSSEKTPDNPPFTTPKISFQSVLPSECEQTDSDNYTFTFLVEK